MFESILVTLLIPKPVKRPASTVSSKSPFLSASSGPFTIGSRSPSVSRSPTPLRQYANNLSPTKTDLFHVLKSTSHLPRPLSRLRPHSAPVKASSALETSKVKNCGQYLTYLRECFEVIQQQMHNVMPDKVTTKNDNLDTVLQVKGATEYLTVKASDIPCMFEETPRMTVLYIVAQLLKIAQHLNNHDHDAAIKLAKVNIADKLKVLNVLETYYNNLQIFK